MEETINPTPEYLKGFNEGYLIARDMPDLSSKLATIKSETERTKGFQDGQRQFVLEKARDKRPSLLKEYRNKKQTLKDKSKDKDSDRDIER